MEYELEYREAMAALNYNFIADCRKLMADAEQLQADAGNADADLLLELAILKRDIRRYSAMLYKWRLKN
jgi:hypothetical protein